MTVRRGERGAMLEEICNTRADIQAGGGRVVLMWLPGHRGVAPNAYADAIAKAYVRDKVDACMNMNVASSVATAPCMYGNVADGAVVLHLKQAYRYTRDAARRYVCQRLRAATKGSLLMGMEVGEVWGEVQIGTARGALGRRALRGDSGGAESDGEEAGGEAAGVGQREAVCACM